MKNYKLFAMMSSLPDSASRAVKIFYSVRADLYTGVSKQGFIETLIMAKNLSQKLEKSSLEVQPLCIFGALGRSPVLSGLQLPHI